MSVEIKKEITTVQVEVPKTNVAVENAVTNVNVQLAHPTITISQAGVGGKDGTSGTSGTFGNVLSSSLYISGSIIPNTAIGNLTSSFSLGSATNAWKDLWISRGTIYFIGDNNESASISINADNQIQINDINLSGSLTASLAEGYIWVGGPESVTKLIATSSLITGGTGAGFPFEGQADITGSLNVSGSIFLNGVNIAGGGVGTNGTSGTSSNGSSGTSGNSGSSGTSSTSGSSGSSGTSATSGTNGSSGTSGVDGANGINGADGNDGSSGTSGLNGTSGTAGTSGSSGTSSTAGSGGTSGTSGSSGTSATSGSGGTSGTHGTAGSGGSSGTSGSGGTSGTDGTAGSGGSSGTSGSGGSSGTSGSNGSSGTSGSGGTSGVRGEKYKTTSSSSLQLGNAGSIFTQEGLGYSIAQEIIIAKDLNNYQIAQISSYNTNTGEIIFGTPSQTVGSGTYTNWVVNLSGAAGGDGTSGSSGNNGSSGTSGSGGTSGTNGTTGTAGSGGSSGTTGSSGTSSTGGSSGTSGSGGSSGTSGSGGSSGTSATAGSGGTSGTSGNGTSGTSGSGGSSGTSGSSGSSGSSLILTQYSGSVAVTGSLTVSNAFINDSTLLLGNSSSLTLTSGSNLYIQQNGNLYLTGSQFVSGALNLTGSLIFNGVIYTTLSTGSAGGGSGTSGVNGTSGTSATAGTSGTSATAGSGGTSGTSGSAGTSATAGSGGTSGLDGSSGTSGLTISGSAGSHGTSGTSGLTISGSAGSHGTSGTSATNIDGLISSSAQISAFGFISSSISDTTLLNNFTGSTRIELNSIESYTASLKASTLISGAAQISALGFGAGGSDITLLNQFSGSVNSYTSSNDAIRNRILQATASLNTYTSSNDSVIARILQATASLQSFSSSADTVFNQRIQQTTASLNTYTGSNDSVLQRLMQATASINITTGSLARIWQTTASLNTYTGSAIGIDSGLMAYTASLKAAAIVSSSTQVSNYGIFARTDQSNVFLADQGITGSLNVSTGITVSSTYVNNASIIAASSSLLQITSGSWIEVTGSQYISGSIGVTGSINITGSITLNGVTYTSLTTGTSGTAGATDITLLNQFSGSINTYTSSNDNVIGRIEQATASLNTFTGSIRGEVSGLEAYTASLKASTLISGAAQISALGFGSGATDITLLNQFTSSINLKTGSFATTGSNTFVGNQIISGGIELSNGNQISAQVITNLYGQLQIGGTSNYGIDIYTSDAGGEIWLDSNGLQIITDNQNAQAKIWEYNKQGVLTIPSGVGDIIKDGVSIINMTASLNNYTSSNDSVINRIQQTTASLNTFTSSARIELNSIEAYTASLKSVALVSGSLIASSSYSVVSDGARTIDISTTNTDVDAYPLFTNVIGASGVAVLGDSGLRYNAFTNTLNVIGTISALTYSGGVISSSQQITNFGFVSSSTADTTLLNNFTGSINSYTSSNDAIRNRLMQTTASLNTYTGSNDSIVARILQATASLNTYTGSNDLVVQRLMQTTASINTTTGSFRIELNSIEAYTASLKGAAIVSSSTQIQNYFVFAQTSSANTFYGNQTITGSLFVTSVGISDSTLLASASNLTLNSGSNLYINNGGFANITGSIILTGSLNITGSVTITSGSITMPHRPAFRVTGNASTDRTSVYTLSGSNFTVDYNQGSNFNVSNGRFTAPISGLYNVYYNGRVGSVNAFQQVIVYKNGVTGPVLLMWESGTNTGAAHFGVSTVAYLAAGDYISAVVAAGSVQFDGNDSFGATYIG